MLYADGLLASPEREHVEMLLTDDKKLHNRLQVFRLTGPNLAMLMEDHVNAPIPEKLQNCLLETSPKRSNFSRIFSDLNQFFDLILKKLGSAEDWNLQPAIAALMVMIAGVGVGVGWLVRGDTASNVASIGQFIQLEGNRLIAQGSLQKTLETATSGTNSNMALSDNQQIEFGVRMTFRDEAGDFCREYEISHPSAEHYSGVACRAGGQWVVRFQAMTAQHTSGSGRIAPAGGGGRLAMDAAIGALVFGAPLTRDEEATVINGRWK